MPNYWTQEDYEKFINIWHTSTSVGQVAEAIGITRQSAASRATNLRKRGVPLKNMRGIGKDINYKTLSDLAKRLEEE